MTKFCSICGEKNISIVSETSSSYTYCQNCGNGKEIALKQCLFDSILKSIDTYLKNLQIKLIDILDININFKNNTITVNINNIILINKKYYFKISNKDTFFLKNNIFYLIEDNLFIDEDRLRLNINI